MRILLVTIPRLHFHTLRDLFPNIPPYSLLVLKAAVEPRHQARILDIQDNPRPLPTLFRAIDEFRPDVIGISVISMVDVDSVNRLGEAVRRRYGKAMHLIVGGQPVTFRPELFLERSFDVACVNQGERTLPELLDAYEQGTPLEKVNGIVFQREQDGEVETHRTPPQPPLDSLDDSPIPAWEGLKRAAFTPGYAASFEIARGCPYKCSFCTIPGFFGKVLRKSMGRIREELDQLEARGVTELYLMDDCFGASVKQFRQFVEEMGRRNMRWGIQIRADIIVKNEALIDRASETGLFGCVVGFEGYSNDVFDAVDKGRMSGAETNRRATEILRRNDVMIFGTHLYGAPSDTFKDNVRTWVQGRRNSDVFRMTIYTPLLGSRLFKQLEDEGKLRVDSYESFNYANYLVADGRNPLLAQAGFYSFLLAHYFSWNGLSKPLFHHNRIVRIWNRRAYLGSTKFVLGSLALAAEGRSKRVKRWRQAFTERFDPMPGPPPEELVARREGNPRAQVVELRPQSELPEAASA